MTISLHNICKIYQDAEKRLPVIDNLSFTLPERGSVAVIGRSGVGKSTLLHLLGGLDRPNSGSVLFDSKDITTLSQDQLALFRSANIGFIFQFHHLLSEFSAQENVSLPLLLSGSRTEVAMRRAGEILDAVGLSARRSHRPAALSGGEQQRVAIARALVTEPRVVLADEPTGNLDPATALQVQELLWSLNRKLGNLFVVATHNFDFARSTDLTLEMRAGGILSRVEV